MINIKDDYRVSYAQNREDIILAAFFENIKKGFYVDVGANDPDIESVTKYFYQRGWSGINIEPQQILFNKLEEKRKRDVNLNIGIGEKTDQLLFRQYEGDGLSTFSTSMQQEYVSNPSDVTADYTDIIVATKPLRRVFKEYNVDIINFMKVDVEGFEYEVLASNDWERWRPQVICIEVNHINKDWHKLLKINDYEAIFFDGLNEYFTDKRDESIQKSFSYVNSVLLGKPIVSPAVNELIVNESKLMKNLEAKNEDLQNERTKLEEELTRTNAHVTYLQNELNEIISLKAHIKKFTKKRIHTIDQRIESYLCSRQKFIPIKPIIKVDILAAAHQADVENLKEYNLTFEESERVRAYRKLKDNAKKILRYGRTGK